MRRELRPAKGLVPAARVALPLGGVKADCSGRFGRPWPNDDWELSVEFQGMGKSVTKGGGLFAAAALPVPVPQPAPARLLTVDEELLVTMALPARSLLAGSSAAPIFEVWLRE